MAIIQVRDKDGLDLEVVLDWWEVVEIRVYFKLDQQDELPDWM